METLEVIINKIKEIDKALDAYQFRGYTFEEYKEAKDANRGGDKSLRQLLIKGKHLWAGWMDQTIDDLKEIINKIYLVENRRAFLNFKDIDSIRSITSKLKLCNESFYKNTDQYSLYPFESEVIGNNLIFIADWLEKYINKE